MRASFESAFACRRQALAAVRSGRLAHFPKASALSLFVPARHAREAAPVIALQASLGAACTQLAKPTMRSARTTGMRRILIMIPSFLGERSEEHTSELQSLAYLV